MNPPLSRRIALPTITAVLIAGSFFLRSVPARAVDLGVQEHVWPIIEIDIRKVLVEQIAQVNWNHVQKNLEKSAEGYLKNLPDHETITVDETKTTWIDPSFVLNSDIRAPIRDSQGNWHWGVLYKKGMRFNPLTVDRPNRALFFFDGHNSQQVAFAAQLAKKFPYRIMLVEASGDDPEPMAEKWHVPVFTETEAMRHRFPISQVPSILYPGNGTHRLRLGLTTFASPYSISQVSAAWPQIVSPTLGGTHR